MIGRFFRAGPRLRRAECFIAGILSTAVAGFISWHLPEGTAVSSVGIILLMSVLASAVRWGTGPGLAAAISAALILDYFFIPPIYSLSFEGWRNGFSWAVFSLSAIMVCSLAESLRRRGRIARHGQIVSAFLQAFGDRLAQAGDAQAIAQITASAIGAAVGAKTMILIPEGTGFGVAAAHPKGAPLLACEIATARRSRKKSPVAGAHVDDGDYVCKSLSINDAALKSAVLLVGPANRRRLGFDGRMRLIEQFAGRASAALERLALSREIQAAWLAAETEKLRSALLTSISHDLKAPLSIMLGSVNSIQELGSDLSRRSVRELLQSIREEGERLGQFISNLIDMSRVESASLQPECQIADLDDIAGSALRRASRLLSGHRITLEIPDGLPPVNLDPILTERALFNILDNAARYTPRGSKVTLAAARRGAFLELKILDEGKGIPEEDLPHLFEKFYRARREGQPPGTGLGLTISQGFLDRMGGTIEVCNRRDRPGTAVTMLFPLFAAREQATDASRTVLFVADR